MSKASLWDDDDIIPKPVATISAPPETRPEPAPPVAQQTSLPAPANGASFVKDGVKVIGLSCDAGYWAATVEIGTLRETVDRKYGSWHVVRPDDSRLELLPYISAVLQDRIRMLDKMKEG